MEYCENEAIVSFDTLYTNNQIQILKVLLPYFDAASRKNLAVMIKFMELEYTREYISRHPLDLQAAAFDGKSRQQKPPDIVELFEQIKLFCTPNQRAMFDQLANMKKSMEMYQEMMEMMQLFGQFSSAPSGEAAQNDSGSQNDAASAFGGGNPLELLKGMLSPEQQAMFDMFQTSFDNKKESQGDDENGF